MLLTGGEIEDLDRMKTCRFIKQDEVIWVPSPDSWLGGWARQRWLERYFGEGIVRNASANSWADMCADSEVQVLCEVDGKFTVVSLEKFRETRNKAKDQ